MIEVLHTGPLSVNTLVVKISEDKVFIVDPACCAFSGDANVVENFLSEKKLMPCAIVLTHGHFDHVSGLKYLRKKFPDIPILISREDSAMLGENSEILQSEMLRSMGFGIFLKEVSSLPKASSLLDEGKTLFDALSKIENVDVTGLESLSNWKILKTPGHTKGSVCLYNEEEKFLISGDTLFYYSWGRTDFPGGNETEMRQSLRRLKNEIHPDTKVYPGHESFGFSMKENMI